jgi:hypothetical protein
MLRWFEVTTGSTSGQSLLGSRNHTGHMDLSNNISYHVTPFDSVRVSRILNLPLSSNMRVPHTENIRKRYNGASE